MLWGWQYLAAWTPLGCCIWGREKKEEEGQRRAKKGKEGT